MKITRRLRSLVCVLLVLLTVLSAMPAFAVGGSSTLAKKGAKYIINCSGLHVRTGAGMGYGIITTAKRNTTVAFVSMKDGWWLVQLPDGTRGYVDKQYLAPVSQKQTGYYAVTITKLNLRKAPKTTAGKVATLSSGTKVYVTKLNGDWGYVTTSKTAGWVALKYLTKSGVVPGSVCTVAATSLNVRKKPSTSSTRLYTLKYGAKVKIQAVSNGWAKVAYSKNGKLNYGYVSVSYLK